MKPTIIGRIGRLGRGGGAVVRLLLLALSLQLLAPLLDADRLAQAAALESDLALSICHDPSQPLPVLPTEGSMVAKAPHCVFCLPLLGGDFVAPEHAVIPQPGSPVRDVVSWPDTSRQSGIRERVASARAPPHSRLIRRVL